jgi:predicted DNA-binding transcriptional regulator YafY
MTKPSDLRAKLKRQIEIVGLCSVPETGIRVADLSDMFDCEELTIKRDLQELRSSGIDIHSFQGKGVCLSAGLDKRRLQELILQYAAISSPGSVDKATAILVQKQRSLALRNIVVLQRCIDRRLVARIRYEKTPGAASTQRDIHPLRLFRSDGQWRLIAESDRLLKQFLILKVSSVQMTDKTFRKIPEEEIDALFLHSFRSFLGTEKITVRLHLSKRWTEIIKPRQLFEEARLTEREDQSAEILFFVNNLEEIAGWVASRGEGVTVIEPVKLREMVIDLARGSLRNYPQDGRR